MTGSIAWRDLSGNAIKVMVALMRMDDGTRNGELFFAVRKASEETGLDPKTASKALTELETHGFIAAVERGSFSQKVSKATQWRLTWLPMTGRGPTNDWQRWQPTETVPCNLLRREKFPKPVGDFPETVKRGPDTVGKSPTVKRASPSNCTIATVGKSPTQVVYHGGSDRQAMVDDVQCNELRNAVRQWLDEQKLRQSYLARLASITESKLSRFLDPRAGRSLSQSDFDLLAAIVGDHHEATLKRVRSA